MLHTLIGACLAVAASLTAYGFVVSFVGGWRLDSPRRPWAIRAFILSLLICLGVLCVGCTGTGSPCSTDDGCPTGWACVVGKCERPEVRP